MEKTTIVVPCFNEERRLPVERFLQYVERHDAVSFLFVDDGSTDGTLGVLERLAEHHPAQIGVLALEGNRGKAEAVRQGVLKVLDLDAAVVGYWDADLATPLEAIDDMLGLLAARPETEIVLGSRVKLLGRRIHRKMVRHYVGRVFATCVSMLLNLPVYDTQCGAKLFRNTQETRRYFAEPFLTRWIFDVEILARALASDADRKRMLGAERIQEFPLFQWKDIGGSKLRMFDFFKAAGELLAIGMKYGFAGSSRRTGSPASEPPTAPARNAGDR